MTRLPHLDRAVVSEAKIVNYLLSVSHSGGRAKARFLKGFGFRARDWLVLREAIIAHASGAAGKCPAPGDPDPEEDWHR
jgi:hypothetical protein